MRKLDLNALLREVHPFASFHDAKIHTLCLNYETRIAEMQCALYIGDPDAPDCENMAEGALFLSGLLYCVIEPPGTNSSFESDVPDVSSNGSVASTQFKSPLSVLPGVSGQDAFVHWFFIANWNAFIFVAATDARFVWT